MTRRICSVVEVNKDISWKVAKFLTNDMKTLMSVFGFSRFWFLNFSGATFPEVSTKAPVHSQYWEMMEFLTILHCLHFKSCIW